MALQAFTAAIAKHKESAVFLTSVFYDVQPGAARFYTRLKS
jgi:hypothetical protein